MAASIRKRTRELCEEVYHVAEASCCILTGSLAVAEGVLTVHYHPGDQRYLGCGIIIGILGVICIVGTTTAMVYWCRSREKEKGYRPLRGRSQTV